MIVGPHYHLITWRDSKNFGKLALCANRGKDRLRGCLLLPAYDSDEWPNEIQG